MGITMNCKWIQWFEPTNIGLVINIIINIILSYKCISMFVFALTFHCKYELIFEIKEKEKKNMEVKSVSLRLFLRYSYFLIDLLIRLINILMNKL